MLRFPVAFYADEPEERDQTPTPPSIDFHLPHRAEMLRTLRPCNTP
jgi:hypothetical protein